MSKRQEEINRRIEEFAQQLTASSLDHRYTIPELTEKLADYIFKNPSLQSAFEAARASVEKWDKGNRPKSDGQGNLFEPNCIIPTGKKPGERVFMANARKSDVVGWRLIEQETFTARAIDYTTKIQYIDSRLKVWDETKYPTLPDLESDKFQSMAA